MLRQALTTLFLVLLALLAASFYYANAQERDESVVQEAQAALASKGYRIDVDGVFGNDTRSVVRDFQRSEGLDATGELDDETLRRLRGGIEERKAPPVADDYVPERGDGDIEQQCKPAAINEISMAYYLKSWAQSDARTQWARKAQAYHGEVYSNPKDARVQADDCHEVVVGKINKWRCNFIAFPCMARAQ